MNNDQMINLTIQGFNVIVRTPDGTVSPEAMENITTTLTEIKQKNNLGRYKKNWR